MQQMQKRSPLLHWHLKHNVAGSLSPLAPVVAAADAKQRGVELQAALRHLRKPFVTLVGQASRARPEASARIGSHVAQASALLFAYASAVRLRLPQRRRYELMNVFLAEVVCTVTECRKALGDDRLSPATKGIKKRESRSERGRRNEARAARPRSDA